MPAKEGGWNPVPVFARNSPKGSVNSRRRRARGSSGRRLQSSSRKTLAQLGSSITTGVPASIAGARAARTRRTIFRRIEEPKVVERPPAAERPSGLRNGDRKSCFGQQFPSGARRPRAKIVIEGVGEQNHRPPRGFRRDPEARRSGRAVRPPAGPGGGLCSRIAGLARLSQAEKLSGASRASARRGDAERLPDERGDARRSRQGVGQAGSHRGRQPGPAVHVTEGVVRGRTDPAGVMVRKKLRLVGRDVHVGRAFVLAALARRHRSRNYFTSWLRQPPWRVSPWSISNSRWARPRGLWISSRVTW